MSREAEFRAHYSMGGEMFSVQAELTVSGGIVRQHLLADTPLNAYRVWELELDFILSQLHRLNGIDMRHNPL